MVSVIIKKDRQGNYLGFDCSGHAAYAPKGEDIVCAAVSALTQTAVLALERLLKLTVKLRVDPEQGLLECAWRQQDELRNETRLVMEILRLGLTEIQKQYPEFLRLSEVEVQ